MSAPPTVTAAHALGNNISKEKGRKSLTAGNRSCLPDGQRTKQGPSVPHIGKEALSSDTFSRATPMTPAMQTLPAPPAPCGPTRRTRDVQSNFPGSQRQPPFQHVSESALLTTKTKADSERKVRKFPTDFIVVRKTRVWSAPVATAAVSSRVTHGTYVPGVSTEGVIAHLLVTCRSASTCRARRGRGRARR